VPEEKSAWIESKKSVQRRIDALEQVLASRKEKSFMIVGHSDFFEIMTGVDLENAHWLVLRVWFCWCCECLNNCS
jgi:hypothetical protein